MEERDVLLLRPIKKPRLKSKRWYKLRLELETLESNPPRAASKPGWRDKMAAIRLLMSLEVPPGSENNRFHNVHPDRRGIHKTK